MNRDEFLTEIEDLINHVAAVAGRGLYTADDTATDLAGVRESLAALDSPPIRVTLYDEKMTTISMHMLTATAVETVVDPGLNPAVRVRAFGLQKG